MTIDEAIKTLRYNVATHPGLLDTVFRDALNLGIEALKRVKKEREIQGGLYNYELPGETEKK